ncbi:MAG TPA: response regulator [Candidatus Acidoferrum sp.]|nr:response regulator [Candidatus Acidoferrum sp.]
MAAPLHRHQGMVAEGFFSVDSLVGVHALVVDADQECRQLLSSILRYCGGLVTTTASAPEALKVMSVAKCDVLIAEVALPGESGVALIRRVRALKPEDGGVVRAIALSAGSADRDDALAAGFDAHLTKPIEPWAMCRLVSTLVFGERPAR